MRSRFAKEKSWREYRRPSSRIICQRGLREQFMDRLRGFHRFGAPFLDGQPHDLLRRKPDSRNGVAAASDMHASFHPAAGLAGQDNGNSVEGMRTAQFDVGMSEHQ